MKDQKKKKQDELKNVAIFPAKMKILPNCVFAKRDPIIIGVKIEDGQLRQGAPVCVAEKVMGAKSKEFPFFPKTKISRDGRILPSCKFWDILVLQNNLKKLKKKWGIGKKVFVIYTFFDFLKWF